MRSTSPTEKSASASPTSRSDPTSDNDPTSGVERPRGQSTPPSLRKRRFLETGLDLIRRGEYFAAHEELELAWRAAATDERDFFQGLVHVAVAWYQAGRGKPVATERQLAKAIRRLGPYAPAHRGVDVGGLLEQLRALHAAGTLDLPAPRV